MVDSYEDLEFAALYDPQNPWGPSDDFYLGYVLGAASALDVGCGTGGLLCRAREYGHTGELVGVDPATGMLAVALAKRDDIEYVQATAQEMDLGRRFELVTMTGHAFQELLDDAATRAALARFRAHLVPGGLLVFETRNPLARAWERWTPEHMSGTVRAPDGTEYAVELDVLGQPAPDLVEMSGTYTNRVTGAVGVDTGSLRFVAADRLRELLAEAGFRVEDWYGSWDRGPVTGSSPEIIVVAAAP